jgi:hypothetical protein
VDRLGFLDVIVHAVSDALGGTVIDGEKKRIRVILMIISILMGCFEAKHNVLKPELGFVCCDSNGNCALNRC